MSHMRDPELEFGDPRHLADWPRLTNREKLRILESWKLDLIELQRAEEENMPAVGGTPGATARKLAEVSKMIATLCEGSQKETDAEHQSEER